MLHNRVPAFYMGAWYSPSAHEGKYMYFEVRTLAKEKIYSFMSAHAGLQYSYHNSGEKECAKDKTATLASYST